jgi:hypothetical protein
MIRGSCLCGGMKVEITRAEVGGYRCGPVSRFIEEYS